MVLYEFNNNADDGFYGNGKQFPSSLIIFLNVISPAPTYYPGVALRQLCINFHGRGWLYAYLDGGTEWKIGMSKDFVRRRRDWDKQCPCPNRMWFSPVPVANRRRAESLAHIQLELECTDRPRRYCQSCARRLVAENTAKNLSSPVVGGTSGGGSLGQYCGGQQLIEGWDWNIICFDSFSTSTMTTQAGGAVANADFICQITDNVQCSGAVAGYSTFALRPANV
ncbi:hypothetical protein GG344DRAFT_63688 [Lentinula edodes]|nr:hypothetical protein GG344DRAFT_63688 [Lentinula edodes]